ncbi:transposase [Stenotrophomonas sp. NLF4-10]|uniref:REP-associated tyrosine transposase n=1 Tax=Stenotrophomonas sp. NLF4-10 TaxID=2918754 RepID=UPI001EFAF181|nr:transposase [Stenotrophomonas sp. NLF4-10]MCG8275323.1 hypothetical protein [Stenotrophomonas sp. NLF4-10]
MARVEQRIDAASMPRYRRHFMEGQTVFLTLATAGRRPWLAIHNARDIVLDALRQTRGHHPFTHKGHVLLDDHLHLLLAPRVGVAIPGLVGSFKRAAMARLSAETGRRLWQPRYYDHIIRDDADFARHLDYLHFNPVKHGLVEDAMDWRWSSVHAWKARGIYPEGWGKREPERIRCMTE